MRITDEMAEKAAKVLHLRYHAGPGPCVICLRDAFVVLEEALSDPGDILALLREWGGQVVEKPVGTGPLIVHVGKPGHYLVVPVDVLAADTGKESDDG